jgi:hypothetical protein
MSIDEIVFYDVKTRRKIRLTATRVKKTRYEKPLRDGHIQIRYALRASVDGRALTKFCSKTEWEKLKVPVE